MADQITIIIPAHNEVAYIETCLQALLSQSDAAGAMHIILAANACRDGTVTIAQSFTDRFAARGSVLQVLDLPAPGKVGALNAAEAQTGLGPRVFLDADIVCDVALIGQLRAALKTDEPRYATGRLRIAPAKSWVSQHYARLWARLPFMQPGTAPGAGVFAVNAAGRARWSTFPDIIADDTYVRWLFAPQERIEVQAGYNWPVVEGFAALVRVRRRQNAGGAQLRDLYPNLETNEGKIAVTWRDHARLALAHPISYAVYLSVILSVKAKRSDTTWARGR